MFKQVSLYSLCSISWFLLCIQVLQVVHSYLPCLLFIRRVLRGLIISFIKISISWNYYQLFPTKDTQSKDLFLFCVKFIINIVIIDVPVKFIKTIITGTLVLNINIWNRLKKGKYFCQPFYPRFHLPNRLLIIDIF